MAKQALAKHILIRVTKDNDERVLERQSNE